ncbi:M1 family metallopeptidase [Acidipila sp. EB88]|uniref:M1 family metallopeptidase n=1 Tax=Acidipila sp. EB88 TaxID=2305226 RepID=UPI000F5EACB0|nr:M1 family metallopeptidase [Acidipila sp. EB88]RRA47862.1 M1 family peptidase [Acidipila sp. EB88]
MLYFIRNFFSAAILLLPVCSHAQPTTASAQPAQAKEAAAAASRERGAYGPYRANNDLLSYKLHVRVDPAAQSIQGDNQIRFRMLREGTRIQIDLYPDLAVDKIMLGDKPLQYTREGGAVYINFPEALHAGNEYTVDFFYSGHPKAVGRFGGITFGKDPAGNPWVVTACEDDGSSTWWPSKDQWRDEVENMDISVEVPTGLTDASNGRFVAKTDLPDGYTRWDWHVSYPINSYDVSLNIGKYSHFSDTYSHVPVDFYALPADLEKAKTQFAQARGMLDAFQHYFGEYPFIKDGYKLIQVPYTGMEHQSAVTYGNRFENGYYGRDWTGVGISMRFDFIIVHESGHEWFGNAVTARDTSDMWIHEGWDTYIEGLYVEYMYGKADALAYVNGYKKKVKNQEPIITEHGINKQPTEDQYFKGALFLNTLRSVVDDDKEWFKLIHDYYQTFKYRTIMTEDVVAYFNQHAAQDLTPEFNQYLRHTALPVLELRFDPATSILSYRWKVDEVEFNMPVKVGDPQHWQTITPSVDWQVMPLKLSAEQFRSDFKVATDLYYIDVQRD